MNGKLALSIAVRTIYYDDAADFGSALYEIVSALGGEEAIILLENDEDTAYNKYCRTDE